MYTSVDAATRGNAAFLHTGTRLVPIEMDMRAALREAAELRERVDLLLEEVALRDERVAHLTSEVATLRRIVGEALTLSASNGAGATTATAPQTPLLLPIELIFGQCS